MLKAEVAKLDEQLAHMSLHVPNPSSGRSDVSDMSDASGDEESKSEWAETRRKHWCWKVSRSIRSRSWNGDALHVSWRRSHTECIFLSRTVFVATSRFPKKANTDRHWRRCPGNNNKLLLNYLYTDLRKLTPFTAKFTNYYHNVTLYYYCC